MRIPLCFALPASLVAAAILAACDPPAPPAPPPAPTAESSAPAPAPTAPAPTASAAPAPTASAAPAPPPENKSTKIAPSKLAAEAKKLGVTFDKRLADLPLPQKKKVMPLLVKALGYDGCNGCHVEGDFKQETRNLKIARKMWDQFVVPLREAEGAPLFCDSCHGGKAKILDRVDRVDRVDHGGEEGMKRFMMEQYTAKVVRADKNMHGCASCHGDQKEMHIIEKLWKIAPAK